MQLFDIVLSKRVYSESNFALTLNNDDCHLALGDSDLNKIISYTASKLNLNLFEGDTICTDCFDVYMTDKTKFMDRIPKDVKPCAAEMEAFSLFYVAKLLGKKAACLMSVVDSEFIDKIATQKERETGLKNMIILALEASLEL